MYCVIALSVSQRRCNCNVQVNKPWQLFSHYIRPRSCLQSRNMAKEFQRSINQQKRHRNILIWNFVRGKSAFAARLLLQTCACTTTGPCQLWNNLFEMCDFEIVTRMFWRYEFQNLQIYPHYFYSTICTIGAWVTCHRDTTSWIIDATGTQHYQCKSAWSSTKPKLRRFLITASVFCNSSTFPQRRVWFRVYCWTCVVEQGLPANSIYRYKGSGWRFMINPRAATPVRGYFGTRTTSNAVATVQVSYLCERALCRLLQNCVRLRKSRFFAKESTVRRWYAIMPAVGYHSLPTCHPNNSFPQVTSTIEAKCVVYLLW